MKLLLKFNLVLLLVFVIGFVGATYFSDRLLQRNAKAEIEENARIMMEAALAVRAYTNTQIKPLLDTQLKYTFLPQAVPSYSANTYFSQLQKKFPDYAYKEATLNPTNPIDRATDWEADIVEEFRKTSDKTEIINERDTPNGRYLYMARPLKIKDGRCLECHDTVEGAPRTMRDKYGDANGFGWRLGDTVGAQIVSVPTQLPRQRARAVLVGFMTSLAIVFVVLLLAVNTLLVFVVVRPINELSSLANKISLGNLDAGEFQPSGRDEITDLAQSFSRMKKSLVEAMRMLGS